MSEIEEHDFIKDYLTVMKGSKLDQNSLIVYNFGYDRPLPFPSIALTPNSTLKLNLQTSGIQSQSRSSIAVVGEKFVGRFAEIMLVIDRIHEDTQALPLAIFLQTKYQINLLNLISHHMHESPSLVFLQSSSCTYTETILVLSLFFSIRFSKSYILFAAALVNHQCKCW